jgi:hypothetical protein
MRFYPPELGNILDLVIGRIQLRQAIKVADSITTNSTILNQTCLSRYQGICGLADIVAAILESPLT